MRKIMITGGFGFIGSNLVRYWMNKYPEDHITVLDFMTYAARPKWVLDSITYGHINENRFSSMYCDIRDAREVRKNIQTIRPDHIIHLAAESHVCRSIDGPKEFIYSNILGTFNLLEAFREFDNGGRFHHVSTDEVYGSLILIDGEKFHEKRAYDPRSPYAASKASSDHLVSAWHHTYKMDTVITNCSNNFGPNQHAEKLVPKAILSAIHQRDMTVYGPGTQVRDWLFVGDHCSAIDKVFHEGKSGETYCVGGRKELSNLEMIKKVEEAVCCLFSRDKRFKLIHTDDRPTDDIRYAVDCSKLESLGWTQTPEMFDEKLKSTVRWYMENA